MLGLKSIFWQKLRRWSAYKAFHDTEKSEIQRARRVKRAEQRKLRIEAWKAEAKSEATRLWLNPWRMSCCIVAAWVFSTIIGASTSPIPAVYTMLFAPTTIASVGAYIHARRWSLPRFNIVAVGLREIAVRRGHLDLHAMDIDTLEHVHGLGWLRDRITSLDASNNHIASFPGWSFARLRRLDISRNVLTSTSSIAFQPAIEYVSAHHNQIARFEGMVGLPSLEHLDLCHNRVSHIGRNDLPAVELLNLGHNSLSTLAGIDCCPNVRDLFLECNTLELSLGKKSHATIASLAGCTGLQTLRLLLDDAESDAETNKVSKRLLQRFGGITTPGFVPDALWYVKFAADIDFSPRIEEPVDVFHKAAGIRRSFLTKRPYRFTTTPKKLDREMRNTKVEPPKPELPVPEATAGSGSDEANIQAVQSAKNDIRGWIRFKRPTKNQRSPKKHQESAKPSRQQAHVKVKRPQRSLVNADTLADFLNKCSYNHKNEFTYEAVAQVIGARSENDKKKLRDLLNRFVKKSLLSRNGNIYHIILSK